jgi:hypothetical protein
VFKVNQTPSDLVTRIEEIRKEALAAYEVDSTDNFQTVNQLCNALLLAVDEAAAFTFISKLEMSSENLEVFRLSSEAKILAKLNGELG